MAASLTIGSLFGISASSVCICVKNVCQAIAKRLLSTILFSGEENLVDVVQGNKQEWEFPRCVGERDCAHIPIRTPYEIQNVYLTRKGYHNYII